jgi:hypothetical protein
MTVACCVRLCDAHSLSRSVQPLLRSRPGDVFKAPAIHPSSSFDMRYPSTEKLTFEELIAYFNIRHKIDPRSVRHAFEETFIDCGGVAAGLSAARGRERAREMEAIAGRLCRAERASRALHGLGVRPL